MRTQAECRHWLGFDLGGTKILAVVFDENFRPLARRRKRTRGQEGAAEGLRRMIGLVETLLEAVGIGAHQLAGIGVGCPGPLDLNKGVVLEMPNLGWKKVKVKAELEKAFGCPAVVVNDVDAGVYGEFRFGAARGSRCVVGVFPGTGIGGGAVYEGQIIRGERGSALEIGHIPIVRDGRLCGCGRRGCLETVAGRLAISAAAAMAAVRGEAPHLLRNTGTDLQNIRSQALADAIAGGDQAVEAIVREAARTIGWAMAGIVNVLTPDTVLLGGGLVEDMPELFRAEIEAALRTQVMPAFEDTYKVVLAKLGGDATVTGAAALAEQAATAAGVSA
jgi:glucokinase